MKFIYAINKGTVFYCILLCVFLFLEIVLEAVGHLSHISGYSS